MLIARSNAPTPLDVIRLTLEMISGGRSVPEQLRDHFDGVLRTAKAVTADPQHASRDASPEAIHLAFEIYAKDRLRAELNHVNRLADVDAIRAARMLAEMEHASVQP